MKPIRHCPHNPKHVTYEACLGPRSAGLTDEECAWILEFLSEDVDVVTTPPSSNGEDVKRG